MNTAIRYLLVPMIAGLWTLQSLAADGPVKIEYLKPEEFTDVKERNAKTPPESNKHLIQLKSWLESEAAKHLQPGQQLQLQISDIDLAGDYTPGANAASHNIRVIKDLYPPSMKLTFTLKAADGSVVSSGERRLQDMGFLMHGSSMSSSRELDYDKTMIKRWLRKEFPTDM